MAEPREMEWGVIHREISREELIGSDNCSKEEIGAKSGLKCPVL